jgi:hypothetical protein
MFKEMKFGWNSLGISWEHIKAEMRGKGIEVG